MSGDTRIRGRCITTAEVLDILEDGGWHCRWDMAEAIGMLGEDPVILPVVQELFRAGKVRRRKRAHPVKRMRVYHYQLKSIETINRGASQPPGNPDISIHHQSGL
jgi:hypothetical protein